MYAITGGHLCVLLQEVIYQYNLQEGIYVYDYRRIPVLIAYIKGGGRIERNR